MSDDEDRPARIRRAMHSGLCDCGGEIERMGTHERDSSNDTHTCNRCGWRYFETETWVLRDR
jgi:predicted SprT family Zn-dependent metalloprotease